MTLPDTHAFDALLPPPRQVVRHAGLYTWPDAARVSAPADLPDSERLALQRLGECLRRAGVALQTGSGSERAALRLRIESATAAPGGVTKNEARISPGDERHARDCAAYRLKVAADGIDLTAPHFAGLFYGLQTLAQLAALRGRTWPCAEIVDGPDFAVRGLSYDISRGRVPTLAWLKRLVDLLAGLKMNQLQLYTEHTYAFEFDETISADCSPLTADELRELDTYAASRRVELVPSLASCGHMARVLSLPAYRGLAEIEAAGDWEHMVWRERARGLTLDVTNAAAHTLLERMFAEYLPLFSSGQVNVCCDETFDLGQGRGKSRAAEVGTGGLLAEHLTWLHGLCANHGKRMQFWADMVRKHPETLPRVPRDAVALHWLYEADGDYDSTAFFRAAGLPTYVCPTTWTWNRFVPDIRTAELNIRRFAAAGLRHGAAGYLNTNWGDDGQVAPVATVLHGLALGAAVSWNAEAFPLRDGEARANSAFDDAFARLLLGDGGADAIAAWRTAVAASDMVRVWPKFYPPLAQAERYGAAPEAAARAAELAASTPFAGPLLPVDVESLAKFDDAALRNWEETALAAAEAFARVRPVSDEARIDLDEMKLAFRLHALAGRRFRLGRALAAGAADSDLRPELRRFADDCEACVSPYEAAWLLRSKPSELHEILAVFRRLSAEARLAASCAVVVQTSGLQVQ